MRGKVTYGRCQLRECRITPAYAGKSGYVVSNDIEFTDHPRLCGEKESAIWRHFSKAGSPPPMRGKGKGSVEKKIYAGITPAYAGKR